MDPNTFTRIMDILDEHQATLAANAGVEVKPVSRYSQIGARTPGRWVTEAMIQIQEQVELALKTKHDQDLVAMNKTE